MRYNSLLRVRQSSLLRALFVFIASVSLALLSALDAFAAAPVYDGTVSPQRLQQALDADKSLAERLERLERGNDAIMQMLNRLDALQQEVRRLSGAAEEQAHRVDTMEQRQHELYLDIDRRLSKLEEMVAKGAPVSSAPVSAPTGTAASQTGSAANAASSGSNVANNAFSSNNSLEVEAYDRAFNLLKNQKYALAIPSFQAFLQSFPNAQLADKAQYWLGEANYIQRKYSDAIDEFTKFINTYPNSSKLPDAKLKLGMSQNAMGDKKLAIETLQEVIDHHPKSTAARMAKKRLESWKGG